MAIVTGSITPNIAFNQTITSGFLTSTPIGIGLTLSVAFTNGATADKINLIHAATYTFTSATPQTIDLSALTDIIGAAVNFARVRAIVVKMNSVTDGATLTLTAGASNGNTNILGTAAGLIIGSASATNSSGACLILTSPNTTGYVVDGTHKTLTFTPSAHAFTADILIAGAAT